MSKHLYDIQYKGHEIIVTQDSDSFSVDIRSDNFDGEIIAGYTELYNDDDAQITGKAFVDGLEYKAS